MASAILGAWRLRSRRDTRSRGRTTSDDRSPAARLLGALSALPWGLASELDAAEIAKKPITIIGDDPRVDVLTVAWTVTFPRAWPNRVVRRIDGVRVPFLSLADLTESKKTGRSADLADIEVLKGLTASARRSRSRRR